MPLGMTRADLEKDLKGVLQATPLQQVQVDELARAVATVIDRNNKEIERELGKKFADLERMIGRA